MMKFVFMTLFTILLLTACSSEPVQTVSQPSNTPTVIPTTTKEITRTSQPSETPKPLVPTMTSTMQPPVEATIEAFGTICESPARDYDAELSPDGLWIAMACRGKDGEIDSHLRAINILDGKNWSVHFADYSHGILYDRNNMMYPFHWSQDGKYSFITSPTKFSGCCWMGSNLILIRLNLENGQQTEVVNYISGGAPAIYFSFSPSDRFLLYAPQDSNIYILDLHTWKQKTVKLRFKNTGAGHLLMSNNDQKIVLMIREYPEEYQGDLTFGSIVLIDLENDLQQKLLSGVDYHETPVPISWEDDTHVLLQAPYENKFWLLNISTSERTEVEKP